ncbi:MAG: cytochrome-c peroxidase [Candidatus Acidiferrales bacterium]
MAQGEFRYQSTKLSICIAGLLILLCTGCRTSESDRPIGAVVKITPPLGLPPVPIPANNPPTAETIALGRKLFYDAKLSKDDSVSCASCHNPQHALTDGRKFSMGVGGAIGIRNAPTVLNAAYFPRLFWDGRAGSLEEQSGDPMVNPLEMDQPHKVTVSKVVSDQAYKAEFQKAFGPGPVTLVKIEKSLASYERTLLSADSPFDQYEYGGDKQALSPSAIRGLTAFMDAKRGNCAACHTIEKTYALFTDGKFHNTGAGLNAEGDFTDPGRYGITKSQADTGAFKTPTLRNVALTAPYMHDGSLKTLKDVVDFYAGGGNPNPYLDKEMKTIHLSGRDRRDLVAFLQSLTGKMPKDIGPPEKE